MSFEEFVFHPQIKAGIQAAGYSTPTPIQQRSIPPILAGRDLLGLAQTGTGKTAAFALPILQRLLSGPRRSLRALILSPTRELSEQTHVAINSLARQTGLHSLTLYGGVSPQPQIKRLQAGVEIAVACPGRLLDLHAQGKVNLKAVEIVVLDEADQMFDMGFLPDIRRILKLLPAQRQTLLFSATMPAEIRSLATEILRSPVMVEFGASRPVETVSHCIYPVDSTRKTELLLHLLKQTGDGQVLVFTRTKHRAKKLEQQLLKAGLPATSLQGNLSQNRRLQAMQDFRSGQARIMVATDIAARGIDVSQITHVINFDMPTTAELYTHRIGRTGRMERFGAALTLVSAEDVPMVRTIERLLGSPLQRRTLDGITMELPSAAPVDKSPRLPLRAQPPRSTIRPTARLRQNT